MAKTNVLDAVAVVPKIVESAHVYRQISGTVAASLMSLSGGINFGFSAVLLPQLRNDESYPYDKKFDSWIASILPLAMLMGCLFSGSMSDGIGRKMGMIVLTIPFAIGWIIMGFSTNNTMMLVGRFITGICAGALRPHNAVYIGEITDPKIRSSALFGPSLCVHIGCLFSHTIGKYVYWKISCLIFVIPNVITLVILLFLKESPLWLLTKGKIDEGIESFRLFRGNGENADKELAKVLEKCEVNKERSTFKDLFKIVFSKPFTKTLGTMFLVFVAVQWCGINTLSFYAQEVFEKTFSGDVDAFMLMLATDCIRISAALAVCIFARILPRKITFVTCCFITSLILVVLVLYLYFNPAGVVWLAVLCMVVYIAVAGALASISASFISEVFPSKLRGFGSGLCSTMSFGLLFSSVKATPEIRANFGEPAMYAGFAVITLIVGIILIFALPETNGKSLQDIEDELYKNNDRLTKSSAVETVPSNQKV